MQPTVLDSAQLDALIDKLKESGDREYDLIIEHLETANADLIGAMPQEGFFNLRLAQETLASLPRKPLTDEVKRTIESVFAALHSSPRLAPSKGGVKSFFQTAGASFGISTRRNTWLQSIHPSRTRKWGTRSSRQPDFGCGKRSLSREKKRRSFSKNFAGIRRLGPT